MKSPQRITMKGLKMKHDLYEREDELHHCKICNGAEGTLPTDCPCYPIPESMQMLIWNGVIDFVVDMWVTK
jgi:hypothetical protein